MLIRRHSRLVLLAATLALSGCPKQGPKNITVSEEDANNPAIVFQAGIESLVPDKKTGLVNYAGAYTHFSNAAEISGSRNAHFNAGWAAENLIRLEDAERHYRAAAEKDPDYLPAMYSLARVLDDQQRFADAAAVFASFLQTYPDKTQPGYLDVRAEYMDALVKAGQDDAAIAEGQAILRANPDSDAVYRSLSGLYLRKGNLEMARLMGDKALALNKSDPNIYNNMGVVLLQNGDEPGAIERFQTARKLDSLHFESNVNLGLIALNAGDYALALECFDAALQRSPSSYDARLGRAVALRGSGDFEAAGKLYDQLIAEDPSKDAAFFNAATLHERYTKDFTKALKYLTSYKDARAGQLGPDDAVFRRIQDVETAKAAEDERKRLEAERKKAEEERKKRAMEQLAAMEQQVTDLMARISENSACLPEAVSMEVTMAVETAAEVISSEDTAMAQDVKGLLDDYYVPMLDAAIAEHCAAGAATPVPAEGAGDGTEAPADGTEAPAEGAEASEGTTETTPGEEATTTPEDAASSPAAEGETVDTPAEASPAGE